LNNQERKLYHVSRSGGSIGVLGAIMLSSLGTKKFSLVESGVVSMNLTTEEAEKLRNHGCVVTEVDAANETRLELRLFASSVPAP
jgi:hypothetical protein